MKTTRTFAAAAVASLALLTAACGSDTESGAAAPSAADPMPSASSMPTETGDMGGEMAMSGPVGPGCAAYAEAVPDGAGSVDGMAQDPVATAASNNPLLKTLVQAVSGQLNPDVNLVDTLNGDEFTVFAPVDEAFAKVPADTLSTLATDGALLTKILTYHVVPGQISPADLVGTQTTVEGGTVEVTGTPEMLQVDGANVICGGVQTANATVYLVDSVLMPAS